MPVTEKKALVELYDDNISLSNKMPKMVDILDSTYKPDINDREVLHDAYAANRTLNKAYLERGIVPLRARDHLNGKKDKIIVNYDDPLHVESIYIKDMSGNVDKYRLVLGMEGGSMDRKSFTKYVNKATKFESNENRKARKDVAKSLYNLKKIKEKQPEIYARLNLESVKYLNEELLRNLNDPKYFMKVLLHEVSHHEDEKQGVNEKLLRTGGVAAVEGENTHKVDMMISGESTSPGTDYRKFNRTSKMVSYVTGCNPFDISRNSIFGTGKKALEFGGYFNKLAA